MQVQVQCVICDKVEKINRDSSEAKKLMNRRTHTYLCDECTERIAKNTNKRHETGKFKLYKDKQKDDDNLIG